jgi:hypothetical protein
MMLPSGLPSVLRKEERDGAQQDDGGHCYLNGYSVDNHGLGAAHDE